MEWTLTSLAVDMNFCGVYNRRVAVSLCEVRWAIPSGCYEFEFRFPVAVEQTELLLWAVVMSLC